MKVKLDENLPVRLATLLIELGHDVHTVNDERLIGHLDAEIWQAAQKESRFFIPQDMDFSDSRWFVPGTHNGILLVRLRSPNRQNLAGRIIGLFQGLFQEEDVAAWCHCFVVATKCELRVLRPARSPDD